MTLIVGNVVDVGLAGVDGTLRVWAWFRPEEVGLIAPYRREWEITDGEIEAGVDVIPGPAAVEIDCGPSAYTTVDVTVPDAESVTIQDLFEQVYSYTPGVVSEAWEARRGAEAAALEAELSAGEAEVSAGRALTSEGAAALSAATLSARVEQPGQDILYSSDGKPYFADPAQIENVPLTVDTSAGTRVMLGDVMIHGDTGWRNVESLLVNGWIKYVYPMRVRRIGNRCTLTGYLDKRDATSMLFMEQIPGLETPSQTQFGGAVLGSITSTAQVLRLARTGFEIPNWANIQPQMWVNVDWITDDPWPTSLPGTPA